MDDLKADSFMRAMMTLRFLSLEPSTCVNICACEHTIVLIMRSAGVYSVYMMLLSATGVSTPSSFTTCAPTAVVLLLVVDDCHALINFVKTLEPIIHMSGWNCLWLVGLLGVRHKFVS